jgi:hypothetical protein
LGRVLQATRANYGQPTNAQGPRLMDVMDANLANLAKLLSMATLIAATIEYGEVVRRREELRTLARDRKVFAVEGLRALVRVFAAD